MTNGKFLNGQGDEMSLKRNREENVRGNKENWRIKEHKQQQKTSRCEFNNEISKASIGL